MGTLIFTAIVVAKCRVETAETILAERIKVEGEYPRGPEDEKSWRDG